MSDEQIKFFSELRKDFLGRRVVVTTARGGRPHDNTPPARKPKSADSSKCFFCPGNEHLTPPEIARVEKNGKWEVRCFPNKFPAFMKESKKAYGRHEVIVETPEHQNSLSELSEENLCDYIGLLQVRMRDALSDQKLAYTLVFKNEGSAAGASLEHSHTQLCSMEFVPAFIKKMGKKASAFGKLEKQNKQRICYSAEKYFALCPKVSRFKHEVWIVPKFRAASLLELDSAQVKGLASALKAVLGAYDAATGFGPYNIIFHSAPHGEKSFPFHVQIIPRLSTWAGFELATEVVMVSSRPHESAELLKSFIGKN